MKKLLLLVMLITSVAKAQTFDFSCGPETIAGEWAPAWEQQRESFEQIRNMYSLADGSFVSAETRTNEIIESDHDFYITLYGSTHTLRYSIGRNERYTFIGADLETKTFSYSTRLARDLRRTRTFDGYRYSSNFSPAVENQTEPWEQTMLIWDDSNLPLQTRDENETGAITNTRMMYPHIIYSFIGQWNHETNPRLFYYWKVSSSPTPLPPVASFGSGLIQYSTRSEQGSTTMQQSWETATGVDSNRDGDLYDLVERQVFVHTDGRIEVKVTSRDQWNVYEDRD